MYYWIIKVLFRLKLTKFTPRYWTFGSRSLDTKILLVGRTKAISFAKKKNYKLSWCTGLNFSQVADGPRIWVQPSIFLNGGENRHVHISLSWSSTFLYSTGSSVWAAISSPFSEPLWETFLHLLEELEREGSRTQKIYRSWGQDRKILPLMIDATQKVTHTRHNPQI